MTSRARLAVTAATVLTVVLLAGVSVVVYDPDEPERHADAVEHYKYGSIGAETDRGGIPFWIWYVLPEVFPDLLPDRPGKGYERFGFVYESPAHRRPIGVSYRRRQVPLVGVNCAACHTGTIRDLPGGDRRIVLGMPSHQVDVQAYTRFMFAAARDPRFGADTLIPAIARANPDFSWAQRLLYRTVVIPLSKRAFAAAEPDFSWQESRPRQGPGRVDTFNPYKVLFKLPLDRDDTVGTADLPSLFDQKAKDGYNLHWDGNNASATERNKSAALGAGCSEESLDLAAIKRVEDWIWELRAAPFPSSRIDRARAGRGETLYRQHCANCHAPGGAQTGRVIPIDRIGTDPQRLLSFTAALAEKMNTFGTGRPWKFTHFKKTDGYASMLLEGVWLRAPFLHNGSVPTLRDLLNAPERRPAVFYRGYDVYDYDAVGFVSSGADAARHGVEFRTELKGNGNGGHRYGTELQADQKTDLLEFLKTL